MKGLETGKDRVKKICEALRKETLEPAKAKAEEILAEAGHEAERIVAEARKMAGELLKSAEAEIERQRGMFVASLQQAWRQTLEQIKQYIEEKIFNPELSKLLKKPLQDPKVLAELVTAVIRAIDKEGLQTELSAAIAAAVPARAVNELLAHEIKERLKEKSVVLAPFGGGIEVKLHKENITIEITDEALKEMLGKYIRKDFRDLVFGQVHG